MEKFKVTKKEMRSKYDHILHMGYCDGQYLFNYEEPIAYSTRAEGWACDYYYIDGVLISTGYAPLTDKNMKHDYDLLRLYDQQARKILYDYNRTHEQKKEEITTLAKEFIKKCY